MVERVLSKPLEIGAPDLMRAMPFSHSGTLHVKIRKMVKRKKWQSRYVVISQGCLYIYEDKNAKHTENAYTLKQFESVKELDSYENESYRFCIKYEIPTKRPILFACDTERTRKGWVRELNKVLQEIQNCSADSGFGSGGTFSARDSGIMSPSGGSFSPRDSGFVGEEYLKMKNIHDESEHKGYDEISYVGLSTEVQRPVLGKLSYAGFNTEVPRPVQESVKAVRVQNPNTKTPHVKDLAKASDSDKQPENQTADTVYPNTNTVDQLKAMQYASTMTKPTRTSENVYINAEDLSGFQQNEETVPKTSFFSVREADSIATSTTASFLSVTGRTDTLEEKGFEWKREKTDNISFSSGDTSPKTVYESPEEDNDGIYENTELYDETEYFCDSKKHIKSHLLGKPLGTFLICPGESTRLDLCVKTPDGDITFRIHEKDGKLSLYKDFSMAYYVFPTLDALLRYYNIYEVPSKNFKVILKKGYNSQP